MLRHHYKPTVIAARVTCVVRLGSDAFQSAWMRNGTGFGNLFHGQKRDESPLEDVGKL
jgi:hypothetical protein